MSAIDLGAEVELCLKPKMFFLWMFFFKRHWCWIGNLRAYVKLWKYDILVKRNFKTLRANFSGVDNISNPDVTIPVEGDLQPFEFFDLSCLSLSVSFLPLKKPSHVEIWLGFSSAQEISHHVWTSVGWTLVVSLAVGHLTPTGPGVDRG